MRALGLDLGTDSIGWALLEVPGGDDESGGIVDLGVRIFSAGAEVRGATTKTAAAERRTKRGMRKQTERRRRRRALLKQEFARVGLLPSDPSELEGVLRRDPASCRDACTRRLEPYEIGRAFLHMATRRGFLSLRKGGAAVGGEEDEAESFEPKRLRADVEAAFEVIWDAQAKYHPGLLTERLRLGRRGRQSYPVKPLRRGEYVEAADSPLAEFGVHGLVFFQRAVYWDSGRIGRCLLTGKPRCERADRLAQRFKIFQTLTNIRVYDAPEGRSLSEAERAKAFALLWGKREVAFRSFRRELGIPPSARISHEREDGDKLDGNETDAALRKTGKKGSVGVRYDALSEQTKDRLVQTLIDGGRDDEVLARLLALGLAEDEAMRAVMTRLPSGRMRYSRQALERLIPHLEAGFRLTAASRDESAVARAGFLQSHETESPERRDGVLLRAIPDVTNPIVRTTLTELRRVYNAIVREYGSPDVIRIEFARDVGANAKERLKREQEQRANRRERDIARGLILEHLGDSDPPGDLIRKVTLWKRQQERCVYSGRTISVPDLFNGAATQVDHVLPRSRTLDDSQANVVVCFASENAVKGERTPYEWLGDSEHYWEVLDRAREMRLPYATLSRLERQHVDDAAAIPQALLVQTGYLTRLAREWLGGTLGVDVEVTRGRLTAELRRILGLKKDRADHRRHAVDATMVALTDLRRGRQLADRHRSRLAHNRPTHEPESGFPEPWHGFRREFDARYREMVVSHRSRRKIRGAFHQETLYGPTPKPGHYAIRRSISYFNKAKQLDEIADPVIRTIIRDAIRAKGQDPDGAFGNILDPADPPRMRSGVPVKSVRCHIRLPSAIRRAKGQEGMVQLGNNHSACVFEKSNGRLRIEITSTLEVAGRVRARQPVINREGAPGEKFLFSLAIGESVSLHHATDGGKQGVFVVVALDKVSSRVWVLPAAASPSPENRRGLMIGLKGGTLTECRARKITVDPIGRIRRSSD